MMKVKSHQRAGRVVKAHYRAMAYRRRKDVPSKSPAVLKRKYGMSVSYGAAEMLRTVSDAVRIRKSHGAGFKRLKHYKRD